MPILAALHRRRLVPGCDDSLSAAMPEAVQALRRGDADALFDDDVMLQEYAGRSVWITPLPNSAQYFAG